MTLSHDQSKPAQNEQSPQRSEEPPAKARKGLGPMQVIGSVFAAGLGVQSSKNRERDFQQGSAGVFIAAGVIFTLLFIGTLFTIVTVVIGSAAK